MRRIFTSFVIASIVVLSIAACRELSRQPGGAVYIQPSVPPDPNKPWYFPLTKSVGDWTVQPTWMISQWGIPIDLSGSQTVLPGNDWNIANPYARLKYYAASKIYELAQNGQPAGSTPCGREFDLLLSPVNQIYPDHPQGMINSQTLDKLDNLAFEVGFQATYENIQSRCRQSGNVDAVNYLVAFIFRNDIANQTLFYQIQVRQNGNGTTLPNMAWCPNNSDPSTSHQYCIDDDIKYVNGNLTNASFGQRVLYQTDFLQRLKQVLQSGYRRGDGSNEMIDGNIAHWNLNGMYFGFWILGGANVTAQWDTFCLIEQQKGDSTSNKVCQL